MNSPRSFRRLLAVPALLALAAAFLPVLSAPASATFPGHKGKIAYASEHGGNYDIWVMNGDGSHKHRITHDKSDELEPAWNPGATKIAYQSTKTGHGDIYTMSPTGHDVKRITSNDGVDKEP